MNMEVVLQMTCLAAIVISGPLIVFFVSTRNGEL